jgi:hypothetical protein
MKRFDTEVRVELVAEREGERRVDAGANTAPWPIVRCSGLGGRAAAAGSHLVRLTSAHPCVLG